MHKVKINGNEKTISGTTAVDLGTYLTAHQDISGKQDKISDLTAIRNNALNGATAYSWGNHANAGYTKNNGTVTGIK